MNNKTESKVLNEANNEDLFKKKIEEKLLERFDRYYHDIKKMKKLIKHGFNSNEDFKNFYDLYVQIGYKKDYENIKAYIDYYEELKKFTTFSFK